MVRTHILQMAIQIKNFSTLANLYFPLTSNRTMYIVIVCNQVWRSISAKIQCSILHRTFHNIFYILRFSFEFALAIQLFCIQHSTFVYATFKLSLSTFNFLEATVQFSNSTLKFSGIHIHVFASNIQHLSFKFWLPTSDFGYCTFKFSRSTFNFSNWTFTRWLVTEGDRGRNRPKLPLLKRWTIGTREFPVEWTRETFLHSPPDQTSPTGRRWPSSLVQWGVCDLFASLQLIQLTFSRNCIIIHKFTSAVKL